MARAGQKNKSFLLCMKIGPRSVHVLTKQGKLVSPIMGQTVRFCAARRTTQSRTDSPAAVFFSNCAGRQQHCSAGT